MKKCPYCAEEIQDAALICRFCQRSLATGAPAAVPPAGAARAWNPGIAAVLSFVVPGLGHIYKGHIARGLVFLLVTVIGYLLLIVPGVIIHLFVIFDAYNGKSKEEEATARAALDGRTPEQRRSERKGTRQIAIAIAVVVGLAVLLSIIGNRIAPYTRPSTSTSSPTAIDPTTADIAVSDDREWQQRLQRITVSAGEPCEGVTSTFHQGMHAGDNFWNVRCTKGEDYAIMFTPGRDPRVVRCSLLLEVAKVRCFTHLSTR